MTMSVSSSRIAEGVGAANTFAGAIGMPVVAGAGAIASSAADSSLLIFAFSLIEQIIYGVAAIEFRLPATLAGYFYRGGKSKFCSFLLGVTLVVEGEQTIEKFAAR